MKILINSYNNVIQNQSGGVQVRIRSHKKHLEDLGVSVKLFNKWTDKLSDYDVLHLFKISAELLPQIAFAKSQGIPIVLSSILPLAGSKRIRIANLLNKYLKLNTVTGLMKQMFELVDVIATETKAEAAFISVNFGINEDKITVIPNGVDVNFDPNNKDLIFSVLPELKNKSFILQVGRFDENKNQLSVIKAMKNSDIPVVFIGGASADDKKYLDKCKSEASENMHFLGWVDYNSPLHQSAYLNAKVVVLPSYQETFGNVLVEGGYVGANLVASDILPIFQYGVDDYCSKLNPNSIESIETSLTEAYTKPLNSNTVSFFREKFSWDNVCKQYLELYKKAANCNG